MNDPGFDRKRPFANGGNGEAVEVDPPARRPVASISKSGEMRKRPFQNVGKWQAVAILGRGRRGGMDTATRSRSSRGAPPGGRAAAKNGKVLGAAQTTVTGSKSRRFPTEPRRGCIATLGKPGFIHSDPRQGAAPGHAPHPVAGPPWGMNAPPLWMRSGHHIMKLPTPPSAPRQFFRDTRRRRFRLKLPFRIYNLCTIQSVYPCKH